MSRKREKQSDWSDEREDYFTYADVIQSCAKFTMSTLDKIPHRPIFYIDSSAGTNQFAHELGLPYFSVDKYASRYSNQQPVFGRVIEADWFDTRLLPKHNNNNSSSSIESKQHQYNPIGQAINDGMDLMIGFNPPYGFRYRMIRDFVLHGSTEFEPMFWCLLIPSKCKMPNDFKRWYKLIATMPIDGRAFYRPHNSTEAELGVETELRIYQRSPKPLALESNKSKLHPHVKIEFLKRAIQRGTVLDHRSNLFVHMWSSYAGRRVFQMNPDHSFDEFFDNKWKSRYASLSELNRAFSIGSIFLLQFDRPRSAQQLGAIRDRIMPEYKRENPQAFQHNRNWTINKNQMVNMFYRILPVREEREEEDQTQSQQKTQIQTQSISNNNTNLKRNDSNDHHIRRRRSRNQTNYLDPLSTTTRDMSQLNLNETEN